MMPYFYKNPDWFTRDKDGEFKLTDKAPPKAIESFRQYKETEKWLEENMILPVRPPEKRK